MDWNNSQVVERDWWGNCQFAYQEEVKQETYARLMQLSTVQLDGKIAYDGENKKIIDVGCGPASMLIKTINSEMFALDPITYPHWVEERYSFLNIKRYYNPAEEHDYSEYDEVWIYNVLQHCINPIRVLQKIKDVPNIRIFEWIDAETNHAHPHQLTKALIDENLNAHGNITVLDTRTSPGCSGKAYHTFIKRGK